ncbi:cytochrome b-c1 complex subunit 6-1, mitochondrial isoform X1 [Ricinus communis]|uniref:cytochrome b-c1 complex subunit 6-1, mitochondrial isoform X1 n=2 Tax=Ricinus communis TaxID=3988 RepID=UPI00201A5936|nr:cytochrome b-c1 complex subunit 6-1, mitochondrial isoform X1 [Ricinus communis]
MLSKMTFSVNWLHHSIFSYMADEELVDQKRYLEDSCKPKCVKPLIEYEACIKRIEGEDPGQKHCTGQYFDYLSCVDRCVAPKLFSKLK